MSLSAEQKRKRALRLAKKSERRKKENDERREWVNETVYGSKIQNPEAVKDVNKKSNNKKTS